MDKPALPEYSREEVARHTTPGDAWTIIDGKVYDISNYLSKHPGGVTILLNRAGLFFCGDIC